MFWLPLKKMNRYAYIAYTRTDIIICTHARVFGAPDIITIWVWIKPHHSASIPSPFTNKRIIWWDTIRCTESRSNEFFEWSKLKSSTSKQQHHLSARSESQAHILARQHVNLDSVWWVEKTDDNNRESHHRDDDATRRPPPDPEVVWPEAARRFIDIVLDKFMVNREIFYIFSQRLSIKKAVVLSFLTTYIWCNGMT